MTKDFDRLRRGERVEELTKTSTQMPPEEIKAHAENVLTLLLENEQLTQSEARQILRAADSLLG